MYDIVRWTILGLLFAGLFGLWLWSRRQAAGKGLSGHALGASFKILQKKWVDQKTGICLVEAEEKTYLLAYTVGGGVSWQVVEKQADKPAKESSKAPAKMSRRNHSRNLLPAKTLL
jgi:Flagellar biosynthesis protein, FliO